MNGLFAADYFDGLTSRRRAVEVVVVGDRIGLRGSELTLDFRQRDLRPRPRVGSAPLDIELPNGGLLVAPYEDVAGFIPIPPLASLADRLERRLAVVVAALAGLAVAAFLVYSEGIPWLAAVAADRLPAEVEADIARQGLAFLDANIFRPSHLPPGRRAGLEERLGQLATAEGMPVPRMEFRFGGFIGPNALALPGGVIVVTDQLAEILDDEGMTAVLAHELGHLRHRHGTRRILQASFVGLFTAAIFGDVSGGTLAATVPAAFLYSGYARDLERDADAFAFDLLRRTGRSPLLLASALQRLQDDADRRRSRRDALQRSRTGYLASHPLTEERMEAAERAAAR
ncbi:MAG TPA: M48 family metallopeptidase [Usitatibacter sp.]|nr:M48 family metallopeptidase [Usitatibacter sp.]